ncbi:hypothetical protein BVG81_008515 [Haliangium sp. UPWRP_2]|nr:hypothetical protein BVG81_008515 [Haliangium sp. UPWRP_2]
MERELPQPRSQRTDAGPASSNAEGPPGSWSPPAPPPSVPPRIQAPRSQPPASEAPAIEAPARESEAGPGKPAPAVKEAPAKTTSRRWLLAVFVLGSLGGLALGLVPWLRYRPQPPAVPELRPPTVITTPTSGTAPVAKPTPAPDKVTAPLPVLKVGILHSLTGALAISERPLADASTLAIEELNAEGGVLGRRLEPVVLDGKSEVTSDSAFARAAKRLITEDKVAVVFGGFGSAGRKTITPYFSEADVLLFYPASYEGLEESPNTIYPGAHQGHADALRQLAGQIAGEDHGGERQAEGQRDQEGHQAAQQVATQHARKLPRREVIEAQEAT